jgi:hypothetical protein
MKKRISQFTLFGFLSMMLVACGTTNEMSTEAEQVSFEMVHQNILSGAGSEGIEESLVVCNSQEELDALKARMNKANESTSFLDEATFNFSKETVIAYFQPVRSSGGYSLEADSLVRNTINGDTSFMMYYTVNKPQGNATMMLTQPFIFIKTGKLNGPIDYKVN